MALIEAVEANLSRVTNPRCPKQSSSGCFSNTSALSSRRYPSHSKRGNRRRGAREYPERLRKTSWRAIREDLLTTVGPSNYHLTLCRSSCSNCCCRRISARKWAMRRAKVDNVLLRRAVVCTRCKYMHAGCLGLRRGFGVPMPVLCFISCGRLPSLRRQAPVAPTSGGQDIPGTRASTNWRRRRDSTFRGMRRKRTKLPLRSSSYSNNKIRSSDRG